MFDPRLYLVSSVSFRTPKHWPLWHESNQAPVLCLAKLRCCPCCPHRVLFHNMIRLRLYSARCCTSALNAPNKKLGGLKASRQYHINEEGNQTNKKQDHLSKSWMVLSNLPQLDRHCDPWFVRFVPEIPGRKSQAAVLVHPLQTI